MTRIKFIESFICFLVPSLCMAQGASVVKLWEGTSVRNRSVKLSPYIPTYSQERHPAVIVCPGGSYCWLDIQNEGIAVAEWLQEEGFAAFILNYRVQGIIPFAFHTRAIFGGHQHPDMISDLQRAIQYIRNNSETFHINPNQVGVMGFSAGGHLAMSSACYASTNFIYNEIDTDRVSLRPNFVAAIYPVVSMSHPDTHKRSRRALLGEYRQFNKKMRDSLSLEKHIPIDCPPVFLVNCQDDPIVDCHNSEMLDSALNAKSIDHIYIQYKTGGHGFGAKSDKGTNESIQWKTEFIKWFKKIFYEKSEIR